MAFKIIWSAEAQKTFQSNIKYLETEWSEKEIIQFLKQTEYVLSRIQKYPQFYRPSTKSKKVRRARMNKYITLFYQHLPSSQSILLLSFWNEKQDIRKLKF